MFVSVYCRQRLNSASNPVIQTLFLSHTGWYFHMWNNSLTSTLFKAHWHRLREIYFQQHAHVLYLGENPRLCFSVCFLHTLSSSLQDQSNIEILIGVMSAGIVVYKNRVRINYFPWWVTQTHPQNVKLPFKVIKETQERNYRINIFTLHFHSTKYVSICIYPLLLKERCRIDLGLAEYILCQHVVIIV